MSTTNITPQTDRAPERGRSAAGAPGGPADPGAPGAQGASGAGPGRQRISVGGITTAFLAMAALGLLVAGVHLTQGTAAVGAGDLWQWATGGEALDETASVLLASRLPRLLAGLLVGVALGVSGALLQSVARNPLASPDTLAVNAGAYLAVVTVAVLGLAVPFYLQGTLAFAGGLAAAMLVMGLSRGGADGPTRLILAGSAITLALHSLVTMLLVLFEQETMGLFAWGSGSIVQSGTRTLTLALPVLVVGVVCALALARRMDLLALGDDAASVLGISVRRARVASILVAVLLAALSVTVAGPIGFVGLSAPLIARMVARRVPGLGRHLVLLPFAALVGIVVVLGADVALRLVVPSAMTTAVPTGVVTSVVGAALLVWFARRLPDRGIGLDSSGQPGRPGRPRTTRTYAVVSASLCLALVGAGLAAVLLGDRLILLGDVANWLDGISGREVTLEMGRRVPRVLAALLAGAALALAGTIVQAVCRNPLAEPGLLGVTSGAGLGAVGAILLVPGIGLWPMSASAVVGALVVTSIVFALAHRGGLSSTRLVLIGVGMQAGVMALIALLIVVTRPWEVNLALTWLAGSTYGRTMEQLVPVAVALVVIIPVAVLLRRELDVVALDEDTPRLLGVALDRMRLLLLGTAAVLTAAAVVATGVVAFVGLVAPHAARALVGARHSRVIPVAILLGAILVSGADTLGRCVLAPIQVPAGVGTALLGTPYFIYLLWRSRGRDT
ncbi:iron ABC transporter permease [Ornithinimicrobium murale]|uniref:iron ABC transporter permease n=1 Tax=Ornithinimicrobium murale TaxID=1050153 RepID=UPI001EDE0B13|nr:iron ABC transporter permease [Ornithinimicrobium murale]